MAITKETFTSESKTNFYNSLEEIITEGGGYKIPKDSGIIGAARILKEFEFEKHVLNDEKVIKYVNELKFQYDQDDQDENKVKEVYQRLFPQVYVGKSSKSFIIKNAQKKTSECITPLVTLLLYTSLTEEFQKNN